MSVEILNTIRKNRLIATKSGDEKVKSLLGVLLGEIDRNRGTSEIDDKTAVKVIERMISAHKKFMGDYPNMDHADRVWEIGILTSYIPVRVVLDGDATRVLIADMMAGGNTVLKTIMVALKSRTDIDNKLAVDIANSLGATK